MKKIFLPVIVLFPLSYAFSQPKIATHVEIVKFFNAWLDHDLTTRSQRDEQYEKFLRTTFKEGMCHGLSGLWMFDETLLEKLSALIQESENDENRSKILKDSSKEISQIFQHIIALQKIHMDKFLEVEDQDKLGNFINQDFFGEDIPKGYNCEVRSRTRHIVYDDKTYDGYLTYNPYVDHIRTEDQVTMMTMPVIHNSNCYSLKPDADRSLDYKIFNEEVQYTRFNVNALTVNTLEETLKNYPDVDDAAKEPTNIVKFLQYANNQKAYEKNKKAYEKNKKAYEKNQNTYLWNQNAYLWNQNVYLWNQNVYLWNQINNGILSFPMPQHNDLLQNVRNKNLEERIQNIIKEDEIILKHAKNKEFLYHVADKILQQDNEEDLKYFQSRIEAVNNEIKTQLEKDFPNHVQQVERYYFSPTVEHRTTHKKQNPIIYYAAFVENLKRSLVPESVVGVFLSINSKYGTNNAQDINMDLIDPTHTVAIKKVASNWCFYDCNLETPKQYKNLDELIDTCLSEYFAKNRQHKMLGTPYGIQTISRIAPQEHH